jgi:hypothetical protein
MAKSSDKPAVPAPQTGEDRDYLIMMYEEHAEHARQHETLRAAVTGFFIALIAALLAVPDSQHHPQREIIGATICALSLLGMLLNAKHYERYQLHRSVLRGFRKSIEIGLSDGLSEINGDWRDYHREQHKTLDNLRLHHLWGLVYIATFIVGAVLIMLGWHSRS